MTTHPENATTRERALVPFDEVMRAFYDLHSAYGDRFFDKDGPRFQEAYEKADKLLGKWQRGELAAPSFEAAARQHEKEARRYEATAQESDEREDEPSMTEGDCARFIAETHHSAAATIRALASAQQEPAPAADAEEVAAWRSMATAPRKDGTRILIKDSDYIGVYCYSSGNDIYDFRTWQPESNERRGHIFANDYGERYCKWLPLDLPAELGAALRRYAGDGGVTDETYAIAWDAYMDAIAATDHKPPSSSGLRAALEAAARARSGEKGETE